MKYLSIFILICCSACKFPKSNPGVAEALTGNWILLYPDHQRNNPRQIQRYAKSQDSIVNLMGLKLIAVREDGVFQLMDSLYNHSGKWQVTLNELKVSGAGKGWDHFNGRLIGFRNDTLQLVEYIPFDTDTVRIVWYLKKVNNRDKASSLFDEENNIWRKKSLAAESKSMLAKKLKQVLEYYALYFEVISKESMYFVGRRAPLPFRYYQHGAGLIPFNENDAFSRLFNNADEASTAYDILEDLYLKDRKKAFPTGNNYVIEYSKFLHRLAGRLD